MTVHESTSAITESKVQTLGTDHFATAYFKEAISPLETSPMSSETNPEMARDTDDVVRAK